jgi:hypothetical protein
MRRPDSFFITGLRLFLAMFVDAAVAADAPTAAMRYSAPITIESPAPFIRLPLPTEVYAHTDHVDLRDLRIVDALGERVPYALLAPRTEQRASEQSRDVALYALPARPSANGQWASPVDVVVDGDRISVRRHGMTSRQSIKPPAARGAGGWLIDLGEQASNEPMPASLRLHWAGSEDVAAGYRLETSRDLQHWQAAGAGQLMALQAAGAPLLQPLVTLPAAPARFVRLVWTDPSTAPVLDAAVAVSTAQIQVSIDAPIAIVRPARPAASAVTDPANDDARRGLVFDLGAALPIVDLALRFRSGTAIAPVRLQARSSADAPWRDLGAGVFYRLERGGEIADAPALAITTDARFVRVIPDARAAALSSANAQLVVHAALGALVFAQQGTPPFRLLAGSRDASDGALPIATLVPQFEDERAHFGRASLGAFVVVDAVAREADRADRIAQWRPWLLWGVLLAGVAILGALVWRLAVTKPAA